MEADHKKNKKSRLVKNIVLYGLEAVLLFTGIFMLFLVSKVTDKVQRHELHIQVEQEQMSQQAQVPELVKEVVEGEPKLQEAPVVSEDKEDITVKTLTEEEETYRNIVLFGVDSREKVLLNGTRSDTIMIASVNEQTQEVKLVSVYRDTFLNIGEDTYNKANVAYAYGGPSRAVEMLNKNLDLEITDYVTVGFSGLIDTVDAVGGVMIKLTEEEVGYLNSYQICMAEELGREYIPVEHAGEQVLNGMQATAYCRIRYTAGSDFKRTQRQREVLIRILEKAKTMSFVEINAAIDAILPKVATSLDMKEILEIAANAREYTVVDNTGVPFKKNLVGALVGKKGSCVIPYDLEENVIQLHQFLYHDEDYEPSETVKQYNEAIRLQTADYVGWE